MKKYLPYLFISLVLIAAILLIVTGDNNNDKEKVLDERLSFQKQDKIPYGTYTAYEGLKYIFPNASVSVNTNEPGYWDSLSNYGSGQALIIVSPSFNASEFEMRKLLRFIENGNDVFVSTAIVSSDVRTMLNCGISYVDGTEFFSSIPKMDEDTLSVSLDNPPFKRSYIYMYPGRRFNCHFFNLDMSVSTVLGTSSGSPNFIQLKAGNGNLYLHLAPLAFSNYFLLHKKNISYYEDILSVIPPATKTVVWDEYYLRKRSNERKNANEKSGWLTVLFRYKALKWALLTALFALLLYVLLEMRRKQRYIPVMAKPRNDSMDFVKTIGRLYFDKGDHNNLCRKMAAYFLEHVRNRYKIPTAKLDDDFIKNLQFKTGVPEAEIKKIVFFITDMQKKSTINQHQLIFFHKQLESFYSKA